MAFGDRDFLGGVLILRLLKVGGIALWMNYHRFFKKRPIIREEKALAEVHDTKEDYLSQLPDDVLSSILARLVIRDAVRTSILSTRWRYLFAFMPTLQFSLDMIGINSISHRWSPYYHRKFIKVVNQVLQLYLGRKVDYLNINFCIGREVTSEFDQLMLYISKLSVEELCISFAWGPMPVIFHSHFDTSNLFRFSLELFAQSSLLKHLVVVLCVPQPSRGVPLNSLRTLVLINVPFEEGQLEGILSSCLNLNQLTIDHCKFPYKICISGGTITSVSITFCNGLEEIDLRATNLRWLECSVYSKVRFYFSYVPVLEHVIVRTAGDAAMSYIFGDFARDLPAWVKSLRVTAWGSQVTYFPTETRIFRNLSKLALLLQDTYDFEIVKVSPVLGACPLLRYLDIVGKTKRDEKGNGIGSPLSPTYHSELKEVRFCGFHGTREEIEFASYIVKSAGVLKRMFLSQYILREYVMHFSDSNYTMWKERERISIQRQLQGQAISRNAVVIIQ